MIIHIGESGRETYFTYCMGSVSQIGRYRSLERSEWIVDTKGSGSS